jgi:hypothetical protein
VRERALDDGRREAVVAAARRAHAAVQMDLRNAAGEIQDAFLYSRAMKP